MIGAGHFDQRVTLQRAATVQDENTGELIQTWGTLATVWARVEPVAGREFIGAGALQSELVTKITIRYMPTPTASDRLQHDGRTYSITSVVDYRSARREIVLMCKG